MSGISISRAIKLLLAVAVCVVYAAIAWQYYRNSRLTTGPAPEPTPTLAYGLVDHSAESQPAVDLAALAADPSGQRALAAMAGLELVESEPADLIAPPESTRLLSARQKSSAGVVETASYLANRAPDVLESFYAQAMGSAGWQAVGRQADPQATRLFYRRDHRNCTVVLTSSGGPTRVLVSVLTLPGKTD